MWGAHDIKYTSLTLHCVVKNFPWTEENHLESLISTAGIHLDSNPGPFEKEVVLTQPYSITFSADL